MDSPTLNDHHKEEHPPMHTAEHILNQTMVRMFGCPRSMNTHIERKKSKCDYTLSDAPTQEQVEEIAKAVNEVINKNYEVSASFIPKEDAAEIVDLSKLPDNVSDTLRIVRIGDYDACACIGSHVENTSEVGVFSIISHDFSNDNSQDNSQGRWRVRWRVRSK